MPNNQIDEEITMALEKGFQHAISVASLMASEGDGPSIWGMTSTNLLVISLLLSKSVTDPITRLGIFESMVTLMRRKIEVLGANPEFIEDIRNIIGDVAASNNQDNHKTN